MTDGVSEPSAAYKAARCDEEEAWEAFNAVPRSDDVARVDAWCVYLAAAERADQALRVLRDHHKGAAAT